MTLVEMARAAVIVYQEPDGERKWTIQCGAYREHDFSNEDAANLYAGQLRAAIEQVAYDAFNEGIRIGLNQ